MFRSTAESIAKKTNQSTIFSITDVSYIGAARRQAVALANNLNFSESEIEKIAIIITELGSNLIKHANANKSRQLLFQVAQADNMKTFLMLALDKGPGIRNIAQSLQDGYSTSNTAGTGLGAISRLADFYNIYSQPEHGTVVLAQVHSKNNITSPSLQLSTFEIDGICSPIRGEEISGDSWSYYQSNYQLFVIVADGLGHGPEAAQASQLACDIFFKNTHLPPAQIISIINAGLTRTRGAAVAIAAIDKKQQQVRYAGLGNISGCVYSDKKNQQLVSHDGTAGMGQANIQEYTYPWSDNALLIMHSDGLISRWNLDPYISLASRHPAMIAGTLYRDFNRGSDDTTVVAVKG